MGVVTGSSSSLDPGDAGQKFQEEKAEKTREMFSIESSYTEASWKTVERKSSEKKEKIMPPIQIQK